MNLLALLGTVWLFTTPAFLAAGVGHDRIGFIGGRECASPAGVTECLIGQDNTLGSTIPVVGLQYAQPIDIHSTMMLVVEADTFCEVFVIKQQGRKRMKGIALMFLADCSTVADYHRYRWYAKKLDR